MLFSFIEAQELIFLHRRDHNWWPGSSEILHYEGFFDIWTVALSVLTVPIKTIGGNLLRFVYTANSTTLREKYRFFLLSKFLAINNSREYKSRMAFTPASFFIVSVPVYLINYLPL